jgi:hypothetical protein
MAQDRITPPSGNSLVGAAARIYWFMGGPCALFVLALALTRSPRWSRHLAYWTVVASLLLVRYIDVRWLNGLTASGEPASLRHWRRYAVTVLVVATGVAVFSHVLGRVGLWPA